ncbi:MAG: copper amine oxidase N-terminal domain-containing protein [Capsulimonadaceae bacterium]
MILMKQTPAGVLGLAVLLSLWPAVGAMADAPISVAVNGSPVSFTGVAPMETNGAVLVPLRGVFQAMGASVDYNSNTHTIFARKGNATVVLPLGATVAAVNGEAQTLSQPAVVVDGTTLVPLRFIAEALGGYVEWHEADESVAITTPEQHLTQLPAPAENGPITGQITGIYANTVPQQITLRVDGEVCSIPITATTEIVASRADRPEMVVGLNALRSGEQADVWRSDDGSAQTIKVTYGTLYGTVKSIRLLANGDRMIVLNDGICVELMPGTQFRMNGDPIGAEDVMTDERVLIRTSDNSSKGYAVELNPGYGPESSGGHVWAHRNDQ